MFRYRCPHCRQLLQALEIRAGKTTVCSKCSQPLTIPADKAEWLNERGEPLLKSPTMLLGSAAANPQPEAAPADIPDDNDVLGAIFVGTEPLATIPTATDLPPTPAPPSRKLPTPEPPPAPAPEPVRGRDGGSSGTSTSLQPAAAKTEPPLEASAPAAVPGRDGGSSGTPTSLQAPENNVPAVPDTTPIRKTPNRAPTPPQIPTPPPRATDSGRLGPRPPEPRRPGRLVSTTPAPPPPSGRYAPVTPPPATNGSSRSSRAVATADDPDAVTFTDPLFIRSQMDVTAGLTAVLTSRMKPPPEPPRDLAPSTAVWLLLTGLALAFLAVTLLTPNDFAPVVAYLGVLEVAAGYLWIVVMAYSREWRRGVLCAVPPLTFWYLGQRKYGKYRPLRFVLTGSLLVILAASAGFAIRHTRVWSGAEPAQPAPPAVDLAAQPKIAQLRAYRDQRAYDSLIDVLKALAKTDPVYSEEAKNKYELAAELKALCSHPLSDVKVAAMAAFVRWGGDEARGVCLEAIRSPNAEERLAALQLLTRWKDPEVARALASRIGRPGTETTLAKEALLDIGGPAAEQATIPLLRSDDLGTQLLAMDILANDKVGGPDAVTALKELAAITQDPGMKQRALALSERIRQRPGR